MKVHGVTEMRALDRDYYAIDLGGGYIVMHKKQEVSATECFSESEKMISALCAYILNKEKPLADGSEGV